MNETVNSTNSTYAESTIVINNLMLSHGGSYFCRIYSDAIMVARIHVSTIAVIGSTYVCMNM